MDRNKIAKKVVVQHWGHAYHLNKIFSKEHLNKKELETHCFHLTKLHVHDVTIQRLRERLLEHLLNLEIEKKLALPVNPEKKDKEEALNVDRVLTMVLNSSNVYSQEYLSKVLAFIKVPQNQERGWLQFDTNDVTERFQVKFMHDGQKSFC